MKPSNINWATAAITALGFLVTVAALLYSGGGMAALLSGFTVWALLPYGILFAARSHANTRGQAVTTLVFSILITACAMYVYFDALFVSAGSTSALVFIFVPFYQLIAVGILLAVILYTRTQKERRA